MIDVSSDRVSGKIQSLNEVAVMALRRVSKCVAHMIHRKVCWPYCNKDIGNIVDYGGKAEKCRTVQFFRVHRYFILPRK